MLPIYCVHKSWEVDLIREWKQKTWHPIIHTILQCVRGLFGRRCRLIDNFNQKRKPILMIHKRKLCRSLETSICIGERYVLLNTYAWKCMHQALLVRCNRQHTIIIVANQHSCRAHSWCSVCATIQGRSDQSSRFSL